MKKNITAFLLITLILISFSMRIPMGVVGPVLSDIQASLNITSAGAGLLTTLPLLVFALAAMVSTSLIRFLRYRTIISLSVALIAAGVIIRSYLGVVGLFSGTCILALGTGLLNALMPAYLREVFPQKVGFLTGIYTVAMTFGSAISAAMIQGLSEALGTWNNGLAFCSVIIIPAVLMAAFIKDSGRPQEKNSGADTKQIDLSSNRGKLLSKRNVFIALYMGLQSMQFYIILSWYPTMMTGLHAFSFKSGLLVTLTQVVAILPSFLIPVVVNKKNIMPLASSLAFLYMPGYLLAGFGNSTAVMLAGTVIIGLANGGTFTMGLSFCQQAGKNGKEVAQVISVGQVLGYILASIGPVGAGWTFDVSNSWIPAVICLSVISVTMSLFGLSAGRQLSK